jgi:hypothetical protein
VTKELFAALSDAGEGDKIVLASRCQFHQRFTSAFFVQKKLQSQNISRKKTFVRKICAKNVDEIDHSGFPAVSTSQQSNATLIRIDSETVPTILEEIMKFIKVINLLRTQQPFASFMRSLCFQNGNKNLLKQTNLYFSEKSYQKLVKFIRVTKICVEIG